MQVHVTNHGTVEVGITGSYIVPASNLASVSHVHTPCLPFVGSIYGLVKQSAMHGVGRSTSALDSAEPLVPA